jgi:hypothetical protein
MPVSSPPAAAMLLSNPAQRKRSNPCLADGDLSHRARRDRCPNWTLQEMLALVDAKREEYMDEIDSVDAHDLMDLDMTKWTRISDRVMAAGYSPCLRDHTMCKLKWHLLILDYWRM